MRRQFFFVILVTSIAFAQGPPPKAAQEKPQSGATAAPAPSQPAATAAEVAPGAAVITLHGLCPDKPGGTDPKSPTCETVITRAQFEQLANALNPNMPPAARQSFANDYARLLVVANEARKQGLQDSVRYKELVQFLKLQVLAQEMFRDAQQKAAPSETEIEKYYQDNRPKFDEAAFQRLFIPRNRPNTGNGAEKASSATAAKEPTDAELQSEGDKMRARLVAGENIDKLEKEVYEQAGYKTPPPPTTLPNWRRDAVPPAEQELFDLKPKEFSKVIVDPSGAYIYEMVDKKTIPLAEVKSQIETTLTNERLRAKMNQMLNRIKPEINQAYFHSLLTQGAPRQEPTLPAPALKKPAPPATQGTNRPK